MKNTKNMTKAMNIYLTKKRQQQQKQVVCDKHNNSQIDGSITINNQTFSNVDNLIKYIRLTKNYKLAEDYCQEYGCITSLAEFIQPTKSYYSASFKKKKLAEYLKATNQQPKKAKAKNVPKKSKSKAISNNQLFTSLARKQPKAETVEIVKAEKIAKTETDKKLLYVKSFYKYDNVKNLHKQKATASELAEVRDNLYSFYSYDYLNDTIYKDFYYYLQYLIIKAPNHNYKTFIDTYKIEASELLNVALKSILAEDKQKQFSNLDNKYFLNIIERCNHIIAEDKSLIVKAEFKKQKAFFTNLIRNDKKRWLRYQTRTALEPFCRLVSNIVKVSRQDLRYLKEIKKLTKNSQAEVNNLIFKNMQKQKLLISEVNLDATYINSAETYQKIIAEVSNGFNNNVINSLKNKNYIIYKNGKEQLIKVNTLLKQFDIITYRYIDGFTQIEIAKKLKISKQAVSQKLKRQKATLSRYLQHLQKVGIEI